MSVQAETQMLEGLVKRKEELEDPEGAKLETRNPNPTTLHHSLETRNPKPETRNPPTILHHGP